VGVRRRHVRARARAAVPVAGGFGHVTGGLRGMVRPVGFTRRLRLWPNPGEGGTYGGSQVAEVLCPSAVRVRRVEQKGYIIDFHFLKSLL
jgi:hypothetical protein